MSNEAEARAILYVVTLARKKDFDKVIIFKDALEMVNAINGSIRAIENAIIGINC